MSSRRRPAKPNLPEETIARARSMSQGQPVADDAPPQPATPSRSSAASAESPRRYTRTQLEQQKRKGELTHEMIVDALLHPSIDVSEADLRTAYSHVQADLRNMALLAIVLLLAMFAIAILF
jgi:hypothetical protein